MPGKILSYELSSAADVDLDEIFDYTVNKFGFDQAVFYLGSIVDVLETLPSNPHLGKQRAEIRNELYGVLHGKHVIFYRIMFDRIRIIRILHGSRDLPKYF